MAAALNDPGQLKLALDDWQTILDTAKQVTTSGIGQTSVDTLKVQLQTFGRKYPEVQPTLDQLLPKVFVFYKDFFDEERNMAPAGTEVNLGMRQFHLGLKIIGFKNPKLRETLIALLQHAQVSFLAGDQAVAKVHAEIETWFNDVMDRLSGAYKRKAQLASFLIGLVLALLLNVDSINVATSLWREPTLRQAIIAQATNYTTAQQAVASTNPNGSTTSPLQTIPELQKQLQALNLPFGWITNPVDYGKSVNCDLSAPHSYDDWEIQVVYWGSMLARYVFPVVNAMPVYLDNIAGWLTKLLGLLLTGTAAAQGAPFWFDILKKFINVRGTGAKPIDTTAVG